MFTAMTILSLSDSNKKKKLEATSQLRKTDALSSAPLHHRLIFENDSIRIIQLILLPGQETPKHSHPSGVSWVTKNSSLLVSDYSGINNRVNPKKDTITLRADQVHVSQSEPAVILHSVKNIGPDEFHQYRVEFK